jgi:cobalamin synthase
MEQNLAVALMFIASIIALTIIIIALLNHRLKSRMVRLGVMEESAIKELNRINYAFKLDPLKWGLILLFAGLGLILLTFIPYRADSLLPYGVEAVFISFGFISYFYLSQKANQPA